LPPPPSPAPCPYTTLFRSAYRGLILTGRYPIAFLRVDMPPEAVDVNVHPTKLEVRFQDSGRLYSQLLSTLRTKFLTADLRAKLQDRKSTRLNSSHVKISYA